MIKNYPGVLETPSAIWKIGFGSPLRSYSSPHVGLLTPRLYS